MNLHLLILLLLQGFGVGAQSSLSDTQMQNARATGYAIVAAKNPGRDFIIYSSVVSYKEAFNDFQ